MNLLRVFCIVLIAVSTACARSTTGSADTVSADSTPQEEVSRIFSADSAYTYLSRQVEFGPRVPNTVAHKDAGRWLAAELRRHGAEVTLQPMKLKAFDGTTLDAVNIFGRFNPEAKNRTLLLAHWDSRPWADQDDDPVKQKLPVDGANDGASGVAVLLEIARCLNALDSGKGVDILFVDAEDWGDSGDDESWALGTRYFTEHPVVAGYAPKQAILLDMVGGKDAVFTQEYFSQRSAPQVMDDVWKTAARLGYGNFFRMQQGGAVTDDHVQLIEAGIPAIDIIEYHPGTGFNPSWHTADDTLENISPETLEAVGTTVLTYILSTPD